MKEREREEVIKYWNKTKRDAMIFYTEACEDADRWKDVIEECDAEVVAAVHSKGSADIQALIVKFTLAFITFLVLVTIIYTTSGCQTVKGVCGDTGWILTELSENIQTQEK